VHEKRARARARKNTIPLSARITLSDSCTRNVPVHVHEKSQSPSPPVFTSLFKHPAFDALHPEVVKQAEITSHPIAPTRPQKFSTAPLQDIVSRLFTRAVPVFIPCGSLLQTDHKYPEIPLTKPHSGTTCCTTRDVLSYRSVLKT
jgi:hypothetical protein